MAKQYLAIEAASSEEEVPLPSERSFGIVFFVVCGLLAAWALWRGHAPVAIVAAGIALAFLAGSVLYPPVLAPLNRAWFRVGLVLHHVVSPVIMFVVFWLTVVPTAFVRKIFVREKSFTRGPDRNIASYWIPRSADENRTSSMDRQF